MQPEDRDPSYLWDMRTYCERLARIVEGREFADFGPESELRLAVERLIEIVGEAARRVSEAFKHAHPEIPWAQIIAQRNAIAHQYDAIDYGEVWRTATVSARELVALLDPLIPPQPDTEPR